MVITSSHGIFSIVSSSNNPDKLIVSSKSKNALLQLFDEKRISTSEEKEFKFDVTICKQEFAHIMIMMIKEINYPDFALYLEEFDLSTARFFA